MKNKKIIFFIFSFFHGLMIVSVLGSENVLVDTAFPKDIYAKQEKYYKGLYIYDKDIPTLDDGELANILKIAKNVFREQIEEDISFAIINRVEIEKVLSDNVIASKVGDYCEDYIIDVSSRCDLNSFAINFETYPYEENKQIILDNLELLFSNRKVQEKFPLSSLKEYFPSKKDGLNEVLKLSVKTYIDLWKKITLMKNARGKQFILENRRYYSLPRWRAYFNRCQEKGIDFVITNVPLFELSDTPTLHLMKRGGLTGGTVIPVVSPFSKKRAENRNIILLSHFVYYYENDFFRTRDLKTMEDKMKAMAYTFLMEYVHDKFSMGDDYKAENILRPANGFKFKEWQKKAEKRPLGKYIKSR